MPTTLTFFGRPNKVLSSKSIAHQSPSEKIQYVLDFSSWVSSISSSPTPSILKVVDTLAPATNVSSTVVAAGSASISGTNITLPLIQSLTLNKTYRVHVNFNNGSPNTEVFEANFLIRCIS